MNSRLRSLLVLPLFATLAFAEPAAADLDDHDAVRQAVERGEIRPLAYILDAVRDKLPGNVVGIEIDRKKDRWIYELRVLDGTGHLFEVHVDARSGEIGRIKEK
jgi:uncharacterized membrane protein YkoI